MAFIKFIIIIGGVYYLLKLTVKALFPFLLKKTFDNMQNQASNMQNQSGRPQAKKGSVTIDNNKSSHGSDKKADVGDYVDFEEVE